MSIRIAIALAALAALGAGGMFFHQVWTARLSAEAPRASAQKSPSVGTHPAVDSRPESLEKMNAAGPRLVAPGIRQMEMKASTASSGHPVITMVLEIPLADLAAARRRLHKLLPESDKEACSEGGIIAPQGAETRVEVVDLDGAPYFELPYPEFVCVGG